MLVTLLGTGTSHGVPVLGCNCTTCVSDDPRDTRMRSSVYLDVDGIKILIDTTPELRMQSLKNRIIRVDYILITHNHADHISGFDDLRRFNELQGLEIPVYGNRSSLNGIAAMFPYIFDSEAQIGGGKPKIRLIEVEFPFEVSGLRIIPVPVIHGRIMVYGYRIGNFAYITDCNYIPDSSLALLDGLDLLVLGVLRYRPHPTHLNLEAGLNIINRLNPKQVLLTHISHEMKHKEVMRCLPSGVEPGFDGQQIII